MSTRRLRAMTVATVMTCAGALGVPATATGRTMAPAGTKTPTQAFLDYQAGVGAAKTLADVLPYLSAEYRAMLESRPREDQPVWLGRLKDAAVKDLKVTKETTVGDKSTLEATGTSAKGNPVRGKIMLVREAGAWKLDEQFWST